MCFAYHRWRFAAIVWLSVAPRHHTTMVACNRRQRYEFFVEPANSKGIICKFTDRYTYPVLSNGKWKLQKTTRKLH